MTVDEMQGGTRIDVGAIALATLLVALTLGCGGGSGLETSTGGPRSGTNEVDRLALDDPANFCPTIRTFGTLLRSVGGDPSWIAAGLAGDRSKLVGSTSSLQNFESEAQLDEWTAIKVGVNVADDEVSDAPTAAASAYMGAVVHASEITTAPEELAASTADRLDDTASPGLRHGRVSSIAGGFALQALDASWRVEFARPGWAQSTLVLIEVRGATFGIDSHADSLSPVGVDMDDCA